jgi:hypothetical protein
MDDRLERAFRSVRAIEDGQNPRADETLDRVLANLAASKVRTTAGRRAVRVWLPAAAVLAVSAVAAARLGSWTARTAPAPADHPGAVAAGSAHVPSGLGTAPLEVEPSAPPAADAPDEAVATRPGATPDDRPDRSPAASAGHARRPSSSGVSTSPVTVASASARAQVVAPDDDETFAAAHRLHFGGADPSAALSAWDDYLRRFPDGRFVPEARYNRAIDLLKMGRTAAAREALQPFADGVYGTYRSEEARAILRSMP